MKLRKLTTTTGLIFTITSPAPLFATDSYLFVCEACKAGTYSDGTNDCISCAAGTYSHASSTSCTNCQEGHSTEGKTGQAECKPCAAGYYTNKKGQSTCAPCSAGTYAKGTGNTKCLNCGPGTYSANKGASNCTNVSSGYCATGSANSSQKGCTSSTNPSSYPGVAICDTKTCAATSCNAGFGYNSGICNQCGSGYASIGGTTSCYYCSGAKSYSGQGASRCSSCSAGYIANYNHSGCNICKANTYDNGSSCVPCGDWLQSSEGSTSCHGPVRIRKIEEISGSSRAIGHIDPGYYVLVLGGGNGGSTDGRTSGEGAKLAYRFYIGDTKGADYKLYSGAHGTHSGNKHNGAGGGGGSWAIIGGSEYIAGGGGGSPGDYGYSEGGTGGAKGAGGGSASTVNGKSARAGSSGGDAGAMYSGGKGGYAHIAWTDYGIYINYYGETTEKGGDGEGPSGGQGGREPTFVNLLSKRSSNNTYGGQGVRLGYDCEGLVKTQKTREVCLYSQYGSCVSKRTETYYEITSRPENCKAASSICTSRGQYGDCLAQDTLYYDIDASNGKNSINDAHTYSNLASGDLAAGITGCTSCAKLYKYEY